MSAPETTALPVAVRVYPDRMHHTHSKKAPPPRPDAMLVIDTETTTDSTQSLTFGSYRYLVEGHCLEEGLFHAADIPESAIRILADYASTHRADTTGEGRSELLLFTLQKFLERFYIAAYKGRCLVVGFNLPFDLSRIASDFTTARGRFTGGFSFGLWTYRGTDGHQKRHQYRPRIGIKLIDSKRALKGFTARNEPDASDLIPEGSETGDPETGHIFRGHFLDLRTVAFALTDRGYTLESACNEFGVEHGKQHAKTHGEISESYIDYNRRDVLATYELAVKLLAEYDKHDIKLQETKAYSPASIGKAYLRAMEIRSVLERQPNFPKKYTGYAQSAFFGGRTSAHIRKVPIPVVYADFLSMYPTVNNLMGLWRYVIARDIRVVEHLGNEIDAFLHKLTANDLFNPATWKFLTAFVRVIPNGDILPSRARYSGATNDWQVGVNRLHVDNRENALWFSLPDVAASVILTGRVPRIVDAFRIEAHGVLPKLKPVKLRGVVEIDPRTQDFFKVAIEERKRLASRTDILDVEKKRLDKALKVLANATSYGIYAEMIREESDHKVAVTCHGIDEQPFHCRVAHPDNPGEYCFPPLASLITGAARLMLALLEHSVAERSGTYAMEDTDSMAIVATEHGGAVPCPGGPHRSGGAQETVTALSWKQVDEISERFSTLNPYDPSAVPGSILKIENDNYDSVTDKQRQLYCFAISAKRYALFLIDRDGAPALLQAKVNNDTDRWSLHGLGHLLNPTDPDSDDRQWIKHAWMNIICKALGRPTQVIAFENLPAVGRISVTSPAVIRGLRNCNEGKPYSQQIKAFNFLLTCQVDSFGQPLGTDPAHFHLIAAYESHPKRWLNVDWIDQYTGRVYRISTTENFGAREIARVKTYGEILQEYEFHPEAKCADANGNPCDKQTVGLLKRRNICVAAIRHIGKESNFLEDVETGMVHSPEAAYTEYFDKRRDEWQTRILPELKTLPLNLLVERCAGVISRRALIDLRAGRSRPHPKNYAILREVLDGLNAISR